jgi:DNA-binding Lrp family transcriptional regulator
MSDTDAFVQVTVEAGELSGVLRALTEVRSVAAVHAVTGEFDAIVQLDLGSPGVDTHDWLQGEIEADDREVSIREVVAEIRAVPGVAETTTALAFAPASDHAPSSSGKSE